jgi:hypothetical protein
VHGGKEAANGCTKCESGGQKYESPEALVDVTLAQQIHVERALHVAADEAAAI